MQAFTLIHSFILTIGRSAKFRPPSTIQHLQIDGSKLSSHSFIHSYMHSRIHGLIPMTGNPFPFLDALYSEGPEHFPSGPGNAHLKSDCRTVRGEALPEEGGEAVHFRAERGDQDGFAPW